jgi:hypothetical protein
VGGTLAGANPLTFAGGPAAGNIILGMPDPSANITITFPGTTGTLATLTGVETFTNKTLTAPTITGATISGGTIENTPIGATTPATGRFSTLTIAGGTPITRHLSTSVTNLVSASIPASSCANYGSITVTGAAIGDAVTASPTAGGGGIETVNLIWNALVTSPNTVIIRACNPTAAAIDTPDTQTWRVSIWGY